MSDNDKSAASDGQVQYITKEEFANTMREQQSRIAGAMDTFGDQVSKAILEIKQPASKGNESKGDDKPGLRDEAVKLIDDPDGYITGIVNKAKESDSDIDALRNDMFFDRVAELEKDYDGEFGAGSFKEQIMPDLMKAVGEIPPKMRASKSHMRMLFQTIKGGIPADKLVEKRLALKKSQDDDKKTREAPAMLRGIGVPRSSGDKLDADESGYLDSLAAKGIKYSKEEYLKDRSIGEDIDAAVEAMRKKNG